ncbi:MAG: phenylalanine--tRNA ligase subunit beta, partial [Chloroflexia bacterium]|nr:phenylalanine--tRNA ligase subunit beta [Chloroflexia bacterium]
MPQAQLDEAGTDIASFASVQVNDQDACPRYSARVISEIKVGPSPIWMQRRLEQCGVRPINNVVDITNYVMLEYGQPMHAFDLARIADGRVIVRRARAGERITTLDGAERELKPDFLVIADSHGPVALAGVMGGEESSISESTKTILLEA